MKKLAILLLTALLLLPLFAGADEIIPANEKHPRPEIENVGEDGYLVNEEDEFIYEDVEEGLWLYVSSDLRVEIDRYTASNMQLIWYTAHIWQKDGDGMHTFLSNPAKPFEDRMWVEQIARKYQLVFAMNGDFYEDRVGNMPIGCIIRNGKVINTKPSIRSEIPTLDILALFSDGTMRCFGGRSNTADEYLAMGVTDTICFGPILIRDGAVNEKQLVDMGRAREPRTALGMVEKGHYVAMLVEGRTENSIGSRYIETAEMMAKEGCVEALNLDGGQTAVMCFMGTKLNVTGQYGKGSEQRLVTDIVGIGHSVQVTEK